MRPEMKMIYLTVVAVYCFYICSSISIVSTERYLPIFGEIIIQSPGYPRENYQKDTIYTWMVTAHEATEEISIRITLNVHRTPGFRCYDYLQIQEIKNNNFTLFKRCGKLTTKRTARGNKLKITLFSNYDVFTAKGFQLRLKVSKRAGPSTIITTITRMNASATTTLPPSTTVTAVKTTTSTATATKTTTSTATATKTMTSTSTHTRATSSTSTIKTKRITTTDTVNILLRTTASTTIDSTIKTQMSTNTSTFFKTTGMEKQSTTLLAEQSKTTQATVDISQIFSSLPTEFARLSSSQPSLRITDRTIETNVPFVTYVDMQHITSSEAPELSSITQRIEISNRTTGKRNELFFSNEMVILTVAVGLVEVTLIIVGILVVRWQTKHRSSTITKKIKEENDRRSITRKSVFSIPNAYDTISFDEEDDACDGNPYKDVPDGFYDTISKRRSHVSDNRSDYSRGSYFSHLFRNSTIWGRRKVEENQPMAFSTFRNSRKQTKESDRSTYTTSVQNYADVYNENPYKDLSDGSYDTISKRRSHVSGNRSDHSRGSYLSQLFRKSSIWGRRKIEENQAMAFSTFRGSGKQSKDFELSSYTSVQNYTGSNIERESETIKEI